LQRILPTRTSEKQNLTERWIQFCDFLPFLEKYLTSQLCEVVEFFSSGNGSLFGLCFLRGSCWGGAGEKRFIWKKNLASLDWRFLVRGADVWRKHWKSW
jgi:hypothetical protein